MNITGIIGRKKLIWTTQAISQLLGQRVKFSRVNIADSVNNYACVRYVRCFHDYCNLMRRMHPSRMFASIISSEFNSVQEAVLAVHCLSLHTSKRKPLKANDLNIVRVVLTLEFL